LAAQTQPVLPELATTPELAPEPAQAVHEAAPACEYVLLAQEEHDAAVPPAE